MAMGPSVTPTWGRFPSGVLAGRGPGLADSPPRMPPVSTVYKALARPGTFPHPDFLLLHGPTTRAISGCLAVASVPIAESFSMTFGSTHLLRESGRGSLAQIPLMLPVSMAPRALRRRAMFPGRGQTLLRGPTHRAICGCLVVRFTKLAAAPVRVTTQ